MWRRRWVIARNGLTACLQNQVDAEPGGAVLGAPALVMAAILFLIGQLLVADSVVVQWVATFNPVCRPLPDC